MKLIRANKTEETESTLEIEKQKKIKQRLLNLAPSPAILGRRPAFWVDVFLAPIFSCPNSVGSPTTGFC